MVLNYNKIQLLYLTGTLDNTNGVTTHLYESLKYLKKYNIKAIVFARGGDAKSKFNEIGVKVIYKDFINYDKRTYLNLIKSILYTLFIVKRYKINVVHAHTHYTANIINITKFFHNARLFQTAHGLSLKKSKLNFFPIVNQIAVNEHIYEHLEKKYSNRNTSLIRYGIRINHNQYIEKRNKIIRFITISRLIDKKGIMDLLQAIELLNNNEGCEFYLAGVGPQKKEILNYIDERNVKIKYIGEIFDKNQLIDYDVFILPTKSENEGFPLVILEAGNSFNLLLSSDFLGHNSILKDNDNCVIFKKENIENLAEKIDYIVKNFNLLTPLRMKLHNQIKIKFDTNTNTEKLLELYVGY